MYAKQKLAVYLNKSVRGKNMSVKLKYKSQETKARRQRAIDKAQNERVRNHEAPIVATAAGAIKIELRWMAPEFLEN